MVNITLSVPNEIKKEMDKFSEMNWSEVARQAFKDKIVKLEILKKFSSKIKLSEKDIKNLSDKINKDVFFINGSLGPNSLTIIFKIDNLSNENNYFFLY